MCGAEICDTEIFSTEICSAEIYYVEQHISKINVYILQNNSFTLKFQNDRI